MLEVAECVLVPGVRGRRGLEVLGSIRSEGVPGKGGLLVGLLELYGLVVVWKYGLELL